MSDLVYDVHARVVNKSCKLGFYYVEIVENNLLQSTTFRLCSRVYVELFNNLLALLFGYKYSRSHMIVIFLDTSSTSAGLLPYAALAGTKRCDFLPMLAL